MRAFAVMGCFMITTAGTVLGVLTASAGPARRAVAAGEHLYCRTIL